MKRILSVMLLVILLLFSLTACGSKENVSQNDGINAARSLQEDETDDDISSPEIEEPSDDSYVATVGAASDLEQSSESGAAGQIQTESNILVVYFSRWGNTDYSDDIDATTSASIVLDEDTRFGTTEYVAEMIAEETGAETCRIETGTPYTTDFDELRNVNHDEMDRNYLPELKESELDISLYDTVFVGYTMKLSSKHLKTALITAAWDSDEDVMPYLAGHYKKLCRYMNFADCGQILGTGCGSPSMTKNSPHMEEAYRLGKSL